MVRFETTRPFTVGEGLTIVVTFQKGHVEPPSVAGLASDRLKANSGLYVGLTGLLVVLAYYIIAWVLVGRDPPRGVIIPLYEPPEGMSACAIRYVIGMGFDNKCFSAGVLGMAVKRYIAIEEEERDGRLKLVRQKDANADVLAPEERAGAGPLFGPVGRIVLDQCNHKLFQAAQTAMKKSLAAAYGGYFAANRTWYIAGVVLSALTLIGMGAAHVACVGDPEVIFLMIWLSLWSIGVAALTRQLISAWRKVGRPSGALEKGVTVAGAVFSTAFAVPFWGAELVVLFLLVQRMSFWVVPLAAALFAVNWKFLHWIKRPSPEGRRLMDRIEGFRMYLGTAERDEIMSARQPPKTAELFERYLACAVALGVESAWAAKFNDVLAAAAGPGQDGYRPAWYHGGRWSGTSPSAFASSLGSSLSSALASASASPSSRSGSGGGGHSGGGGGGGGGGGR